MLIDPEVIYPDVAQRLAESRELMRSACQSTLDMADRGMFVDSEHLAYCRAFVNANPPLGRPLSTGEPVEMLAHEAATEEHKARLAADPRFAATVAGSKK